MTLEERVKEVFNLTDHQCIYACGDEMYRTYLEAASHSKDGYVIQWYCVRGTITSKVLSGGH